MKRHYSTIDSKTHHTIVLSDASYNMAMDWLQRELAKTDREIFRCDNCGTNHMEIYTGMPQAGLDVNGRPDVWYNGILMFYYDEERGLLMQE